MPDEEDLLSGLGVFGHDPTGDIRQFLDGLTPETLAGSFDRAASSPYPESERELCRWPIIEASVPDHPLDDAEQVRIFSVIGAGIDSVREAIAKLGREGFAAPDEALRMQTLIDVVLRYAKSPEQVTRAIRGYIKTQVMLVFKDRVRIRVQKPSGEVSEPVEVEEGIVRRTPARQKTLRECARNPEWVAFRHALDTKSFKTYTLEPGNDSTFTLLADPSEVYLLDFNPEDEGVPIPKVPREIPEGKRMTKEKLARFFSMPGLHRLIETDAYQREEAAIGTSLSILAEYFCENDDVVYRNRVTVEDVQKWLEEKFVKHKPPLEIAWYVWGRLNGTAFDSAATVVEQYILDFHQEHQPWVFNIGILKRNNCRYRGRIFELYACALKTTLYSFSPDDKKRYPDVLRLLPSLGILQTVIASPASYAHDHVRELLVHLGERGMDFAQEFAKVGEIDLATDPLDLIRDLLNKDWDPDLKWTAYPGFELLDPVEIKKCANQNKYNGAAMALKVAIDKLLKIEDAKVLLRFRREVLDHVDPVVAKSMQSILERAALPIVAKTLFGSLDSDKATAVAREQRGLEVPSVIILPGNVEYADIVGHPFDPHAIRGGLTDAAEYEIARRHLEGARGADAIARYLMEHVDTIRPSEVVRPNPDAPHREIVREFGESPDALALLDMATLLTYTGEYDPDQVMTEIAMQARLTAMESRPELAMIGVELEMVSASPEGQIVDRDVYPRLFNVLPRDLKDRSVNEVVTAPTSSPVMQDMMLSMIADRRFRYIDPDVLWAGNRRPDRSLSSIHLNVSIPDDIPFTPELIAKYMAEIQGIQWMAHGGFEKQRLISIGGVSGWRRSSLLDVTETANKVFKVEFRNLRLEEDGSHITRIRQLQLIASACIQLMRVQGGVKVTQHGKVMAEIYERFRRESRLLREGPQGASEIAAALIEKYSNEIATELGLFHQPKREGIILTK